MIPTDRHGSVVAAAGCGKTEQIVLTAKGHAGCRLILTHTHSGVDALRKRFKDHGVEATAYRIETIAGWCLRYTSSFPERAGRKVAEPSDDASWRAVYAATVRLIDSGAVDRVLPASYCGVFVDEYQDCTEEQHAAIKSLSRLLPTCVFGDHMQAIFDFKGQRPVNWTTQVFTTFPQAASLLKPWRWHKVGNSDMANWLRDVRDRLEHGQSLDFSTLPSCVEWKWLPDLPGPRSGTVTGTCKSVMSRDGRLVVIADPTNLEGRAAIARGLAKQRFSNIEPASCKTMFAFAKRFDGAADGTLLPAIMDLLQACMTDVGAAALSKAVHARMSGGRRGAAEFGHLIDLAVAVQQTNDVGKCLELVEGFRARPSTHVFRSELLSSIRLGLQLVLSKQFATLAEALTHVQNRRRHMGRHIPRRSVGSTLLVKGLEFEHAVIVHSENMGRRDWYVALTRATHTVTILAPKKLLSLRD